MFCREHLSEFREVPDLNLAIVTMADPPAAEALRTQLKVPHPFLCDPEKVLYATFGLGKGRFGQMFNPHTFARGVGAMVKGHGVGAPVGDPWQMPGAFVIARSGEVTWAHLSQDAADNPTLAALREAWGRAVLLG